MVYNWETCSSDIRYFVIHLQEMITEIINEDIIGFYIHGSLAMGGFNPKRSDIDVLVVTNNTMTVETKRKLGKFVLGYSSFPFPVEISFLNQEQLRDWQHPCPFDFHYSESWRERYEKDLFDGTFEFINDSINTDPDLAAHITITNHREYVLTANLLIEFSP